MALVLKMRAQTAFALVPWLTEVTPGEEEDTPARHALACAVKAGMTIGVYKARLVLPDKQEILDELISVLKLMTFVDIHSNFRAASWRLLQETRAFRGSAVDKLAKIVR